MQQRLTTATAETGQIAHWGLSLGLQGTIEAWLEQSPEQLNSHQERGLRFRIARNHHQPNAHQILLGASRLETLQQRWQAIEPSEEPIRIVLQGGLGDHLQDLSALLPWLRVRQHPVQLGLTPIRANQFSRLLQAAGCEHLLAPTDSPAATDLHILEVIALVGSTTLQPQAWIPRQASAMPQAGLVCCWTAVGTDDPFSAWSRSVPFCQVLELYRTLLANGWTAASIVDLSRWRPWEAEQLRQLGLQLVDPARGDVLDLTQQVSGASTVVSIDTALPHLCAAMGRPVWLLLPQFSDERWVELLQPGTSYSQHCQVIRQQQHGCWRGALDRLSRMLRSKNGPTFAPTAPDGLATNG